MICVGAFGATKSWNWIRKDGSGEGELYDEKTTQMHRYPFPYHYRPFRPYRITRDLTIMPGATLTIEKNVEAS